MNVAIIVFAGSGVRMNTSIPKQFIKVNDNEVVSYTISTFNKSKNIDEIILVTNKDYLDYVDKLVKKYHFDKVKKIVSGGSSRQESVKLGLLAKEYSKNDNVLIHDGDRPLVSSELIDNIVISLDKYKAVCPYIPHGCSIKEVSNLGRTKLIKGVESDVQTPQAFKYRLIKDAHIKKENSEFSDDIGLIEDEVEVCYILGDKYNFKITKDIDLEYFARLVGERNE